MTIGNDDFVPVLLGTGLNTYNIARCLHARYGVRSLALGRVELRETARSAIVEVRASRDFDEPESIVRTLQEVAREFEGRRLLLIPTIEYYTNVVIDHRAQLEGRYLIPLVGRELADRLMNKSDFYATCAQLGIPHPRTVVIGYKRKGDASIGEDLPFDYPVILKPSNTDLYPRLAIPGKQKVYLLPTATALREVVDHLFGHGYDDALVVQEYIAGNESVMRVANTYSDRGGVMKFASVGQVVLADHDPRAVGNNNAILSIDDPALVASLQKLLDGVGFHGTANADVMFDRKDGVSKVLELNLRQGATSFYTMAGGGDIVAALVEDVVYGRQLDLTVTTRERLWINLPYVLAPLFAPRGLRARTLKAGFLRARHTLWYRSDLSPARIVTVLKHNARYTLSTLKYARSGLNR